MIQWFSILRSNAAFPLTSEAKKEDEGEDVALEGADSGEITEEGKAKKTAAKKPAAKKAAAKKPAGKKTATAGKPTQKKTTIKKSSGSASKGK